MIYIKTYEENKDGDKFMKLHFCRKCIQMTNHLDGKCLKCKKNRETEKDRKKNFKL